MKTTLSITTLLVLGSLASAPATVAEESAESELGWSDVAELTYVATGGNAEAETLGFRNTLKRTWEGATFTLEAGGLRAESTTTTRVVVDGPVGDPLEVRELSTTTLTAENYYLRGRYDQMISERLYWFAGAGWSRNEFAGVANRSSAQAGVGHLWFEDEGASFRTDYAVTFTDEEDLVGGSESFAGVRLGWDYQRKLSSTTGYTNVLLADVNADETSDYRLDMIQSVSVAMSERLALKVSLQLLYDNVPSLTPALLIALPDIGDLFPPFDPSGGLPVLGTVFVPLDELDTVFNVALVVDF